ncbi:MAG: 3D domain-containing protein [Candidatus Staskawiczbacteria bacterium]|jgi:3D (Asp-Asp-Asp) domain-containing protein
MINFKNNAILGGKTPLIGSIFAGIIVGICLLGIIMPQTTNADFANTTNALYVAKTTNVAQKAVKTIKVVVTAYSSTPDQTDDTPFITASGQYVRDGIVANNLLPLGTKIKIPELYGNKIFTVEDRMAWYKSNYHIDIWMPSRPLALNFGVKTAEIEILEN